MEYSNPNLSSVRRILRELSQLNSENSSEYKVHLVDDQLFELHFTIRAPPDTPYAKGRYHGKLILPHDYPFKPPELVFLTPSGRFEVNKKICLSVTSYHVENWQPAWGIRTFLIGISSFMAVESVEAIGSMQWTAEERATLAEKSNSWICPDCKKTNLELLPEGTRDSSMSTSPSEELQFNYVSTLGSKNASSSASASAPTKASASSPPITRPSVAPSTFSQQPSPPPQQHHQLQQQALPMPQQQAMHDENEALARMQKARLDFIIVFLLIIILALIFK